MAIDWEYLLNTEDGEHLQDAYDELCPDYLWEDDNWDDWDGTFPDDCEENEEELDSVLKGLLGTCAAGEIALASSSLVQRFHLRLLSKITIDREHNICDDNIFGKYNAGKQCFDYLLATEDAAVLGILLTNDHDLSYSEHDPCGLPVLRVPERHMEQGNVYSVLDRLEQSLAPLLLRQDLIPLSMRIDPIPVNLHARMTGLHMIQPREGHLWEPTAYGYSLGIREGYLPPLAEDTRPLHTFFVLETQKDKLDEALSWNETRPKPADTQRTWKQIMDRLNQGLPCSDAHATAIVRAFGIMPFADYMAPCPKEQKLLRKELGEPATYQEAADRLYRLCIESERTKENNERFMDLIYSLIRPIFLIMETMKHPPY